MQILALAAIRAEDGQVVHESGSDPPLSNSPPQMWQIRSNEKVVDPSDGQGNLELQESLASVNTEQILTDSNSEQKA